MNALPSGFLLLAQQSAPDAWSETLFGLHPEQRAFLLFFAIGCTVALILGTLGIVSSTINKVHRRRVEMEMKRDMLDRGMSADEIATVIEAVTPPEDATQRWIASWACRKK